jgi:hypothetical protein
MGPHGSMIDTHQCARYPAATHAMDSKRVAMFSTRAGCNRI